MSKLLQSQASESLVLGALINHLDWILEFTDLKADYFSIDVNKIIFVALKKLYKNGATSCEIIDIYALIETNKQYLDKLEEYGGTEYIETLSELAEGKELNDIAAHVKIVIDTAYKNELQQTLVGLTSYVESNTDKSKEYVSKVVEGELLDLKGKYGGIKKAEMLGEKMDKILESLDRDTQTGYSGIPTSIPLLNKFCTYQRGEMIVVGGLAKFGKSQFVVDQAYWLAIVNKVPVMILDTELSTKKFVSRMLARITGYSFGFIATGKFKEYDGAKRKVEYAIKQLKEAPITHTYIVDWGYQDIVDEVKRMKIQHNIQVLFYDYLKVEEVGGAVKEADQLGNLTNLLKNKVAGDLDIAVVALAQTSDYSKMEGGLRLANSQKIKNYASTVIYLSDKTADVMADSFGDLGGNVTLFISHNRNGSQMPADKQNVGINLNFNKRNATITQADYQFPEIIDLAAEEDYSSQDFSGEVQD